MDVNNINPILEAFTNILPQIGFQSIQRKDLSLAGSIIAYKGLMVNVGVMGPLRGAIVILMDTESAKKFASKMMMGMEVAELDNMAQSAIAEMSNMVCANACTNFAQSGVIGLDISPPTILISDRGQARLPASQIIMIKFVVDEIDIQLGIGLV